jgi:predicted nucleotide-binding protein (sugar kinase/HSP70/actin superfamily)
VNDFGTIRIADATMATVRRQQERVLIPLLGPAPAAFAACLRGIGIQAECLPFANADAVRTGRRYTSGKECLPMCMTLGLLLQRIEADNDPAQQFVFGLPSCRGPCRFGVYNLLNRITLERLGLNRRVRIWSPQDSNYFEGLPPGFSTLVFAGFVASDLLEAALLDTRPGETIRGASRRCYDGQAARLLALLEKQARGDLSLPRALWEVATGRLFGVTELLAAAAAEYAPLRGNRERPTVLMVGGIYARCNEFANDFLIDKLEQRGLRVRLAPFTEWLEYADAIAAIEGRRHGLSERLRAFLQSRIRRRTYAAVAAPLGWPALVTVSETLAAAAPYLPAELRGEAVLTVGGPLHEWHHGLIDGVVNVGPHECMPSKVAEAQLFHAAEREHLLSLSLPLNGDPIDPEILDNFAFEIHHRFRQRSSGRPAPEPHSCRSPACRAAGS